MFNGRPPGRELERGVGEGIVVKGPIETSVRGAGVKAGAPRSGVGAQRRALTPASTRGDCRPDDAVGGRDTVMVAVAVARRPTAQAVARRVREQLVASAVSGASQCRAPAAPRSTVGTPAPNPLAGRRHRPVFCNGVCPDDGEGQGRPACS